MGIEAVLSGWFDNAADWLEQVLFLTPKLKKERTEKTAYLLCGEKLVKVKFVVEKEQLTDWQRFTCEIVEIEGEALDPTILQSIEGSKRAAISKEDAEHVVKEILEGAGLSTERMVPMTDRYADPHRRMLSLKKTIEGREANDC